LLGAHHFPLEGFKTGNASLSESNRNLSTTVIEEKNGGQGDLEAMTEKPLDQCLSQRFNQLAGSNHSLA